MWSFKVVSGAFLAAEFITHVWRAGGVQAALASDDIAVGHKFSAISLEQISKTKFYLTSFGFFLGAKPLQVG